MARRSSGSRKKVTAETLVELGAERLAEILADVADTRVDLKRRLRMELAAQEGPGPLTVEIDKRLSAFETSRGQITWRQAPAFIRDLDALRDLIVARLAPLDASAAIDRLWRFMAAAPQSYGRYRERNGELEAVFEHAAADLGALLAPTAVGPASATLVEAVTRNPSGWKAWLPALLRRTPKALAEDALQVMSERRGAVPGWITLVRQLADAAENVDAYAATYEAAATGAPHVAVELARRYLAADRVEEAGAVLARAAPKPDRRGRLAEPDGDWEAQWIAFLEASGRGEEAQAVRWASFERTLSVERARAFISRLPDFEDVEAETRAFERAANFPDFEKGLGFLMAWPALPDAARMIERRIDDVDVAPAPAELWAGKLRRRFPKAAHTLLRRAAAAAFRRRDFKDCDRLSAEADTILP